MIDRSPTDDDDDDDVRADLLRRHEALRADLQELLDVAAVGGWAVDRVTVDGLFDRVAALGEDLADGPHLGTEPASGSSTEAYP